ncbi:septal ring lytic transglycosylase RlpA family protein [Rhodopila sp.]|uniref:septal ring lytic transglycosylase RlpA family protein n=1 Tax=Rhodopila sp. TaxID=2480087 RepID=UPI003D13F8B0
MRILIFTAACLLVAGTALAQPNSSKPSVDQQGQASYFNHGQDGHSRTANGEPVQPDRNTAASRTLPLGTNATVTNKATGQSTQVHVNDRGPVRKDRVIDLSRKAAGDVGMSKTGTAPVVVRADPNQQSDPTVKRKLVEQAK